MSREVALKDDLEIEFFCMLACMMVCNLFFLNRSSLVKVWLDSLFSKSYEIMNFFYEILWGLILNKKRIFINVVGINTIMKITDCKFPYNYLKQDYIFTFLLLSM